MTDPDARRQAALRDLDRLRHEGDALRTLFGRSPAPAEAGSDPATFWGARIGRALSVIAILAVCLYLVLAYLR